MRRSQLIVIVTIFIISLESWLVPALAAQRSQSSQQSRSAHIERHKASPASTRSSTVGGTHSTSGRRSSRRPAFHAPLHGTPKHLAIARYVMPSAVVIAQWQKVAVCEEGGNWRVRGSLYSGGLGITNHNWTYFSRGLGFPASAADAAPWQQVIVAERIEGGSGYVPDQKGCGGSW